MMKKRYAVMMTAAMLTGIMTATALAEGSGMDDGMQMSGPQMPEMNGEAPQMNENGQPPQMDGQQAPQGEAPAASENGEAPQMPENGQLPQMGENGQAPQMNGKGSEDNFGFISFENYVTDGTISQETYEAITKFMEENKPELPEVMTEEERPELPKGAAEGERPELLNGEIPEMKEGEGPDLLKDLLDNRIITQEEYDALAAAREANGPAAPAADQNAESTQTTDGTTGA